MRARTSSLERWRGLRSTRHLGRRLLILYAITAAVVAAVFSTALLSSWLDTFTLVSATERGVRTHETLATLEVAERDGPVLLINYLLTGDAQTLESYRSSMIARQAALDRLATMMPRGAGSLMVSV